VERALKAGMPPQAVADAVFAAIREGRFSILTHPAWKVAVERRMQAILQERNPNPAWSHPAGPSGIERG
jgi:hypothetical protein